MTRGKWRLGVARWLASTVGEAMVDPNARPAESGQSPARTAPSHTGTTSNPVGTLLVTSAGTAPTAGGGELSPVGQAHPAVPDHGPYVQQISAWKNICEQFALRMLTHAEQLRPELDSLEEDESNSDRLDRLYQVDHGVAQIRRAACDLRVLTGRESDDISGHTTTLLDVVRVGISAIEHYGQISLGTVAELAVVAYAADDIAYCLAALADNATKYSPGLVTISAHLMADGGVMVRIEDAGFGIRPDWVASLNKVLSGPIPDVDGRTGTHTGLAVAHRLARKHGLAIHLATRQPPGVGQGGMRQGVAAGSSGTGTGTIAMVTIGAQLLCEIPRPDMFAPLGGVTPGGIPTMSNSSLSSSGSMGPATGPMPAQRRPTLGGPPPAPASSSPPAAPAYPAPGRHRGPLSDPMPAAMGHDDDGPPTFPTVNGLPKRESTSLRGTGQLDHGRPSSARHSASSPHETAASSRSFADDVAAFTSSDFSVPPASTSPNDQPDGPEGQMPR